MLGNILNQGNATATLPEDRKSSKCLPNASSRPKRKQASELKLVS
jgi:hypothetical protein